MVDRMNTEDILAKEIRRLVDLLQFVDQEEHQAFQFFRIKGKPYKVTIRRISEQEYKP